MFGSLFDFTFAMRRDGYNKSLWQSTTKDFEGGKVKLDRDPHFDVIIAGGGITGITTGLLLQKAGKSVLIAEAQTIGFGTTSGTTAHLNTFMDTPYHVLQKNFGKKDTALVATAARQALELIKRQVEEYEINCGYKELPAYLFSQNETQTLELERIQQAAIECMVNCAWTEKMPLPFLFEKALIFDGQATFHPTRYLTALARAFEKEGGIIMEHCRVTKLEEGIGRHTAETSCGNFSTTFFIYATHIPPGVNLLHFRCAPYRSYAMATILENKEEFPDALVYDMYDPYHYYRTQQIDGRNYFIAGGEDHKTGHEDNTENCFRKLEAHIRKHFRSKEISNQWSSQYFEPADGLPYIGQLPGHAPEVYVATGYGGNGMIYSSVAAILLTDRIAGSPSAFDELFDPNRIKMIAGFSNFIKEASDVVGHLIKKMVVPAEALKEWADLAPGEARKVKYEGQRLALYKNEKSEIYAVNAACTHIKCDVAWNNTEKTWDCPCHGSRFSYTGEMLTAPARKDLSSVEIN